MSIVLPAFNEADRIGVMLDELVAWLDAGADDLDVAEIVVVDDGSSDTTVAVVESYETRLPRLRLVSHPHNLGKGAAVATGMLAAQGTERVFLDADGSTPPADIARLVAATGPDRRTIAIGSLRVPGAEIRRRQPPVRSLAGRVGNLVVRSLVVPGVRDTQRGAKLFPAEIAEVVFADLRSAGWGFDMEVLARCRAAGYRIVEVPVRWRHVDGGQIRASSYFWTLRDVVAIRRELRRDGIRRGRAGGPARRRIAAQSRTVQGLMPLRRDV